MGNACTVVGPGDAVAVVVAAEGAAVGGAAEDDVGSVIDGVEGAVVTHTDEGRVGVSDHIQGQAGDNVSLPASGLAAGFSRLDSGESG